MKNLEKQLPEVAIPIEDDKKYILKLPEDTDPFLMEELANYMKPRLPNIVLVCSIDFELYKIED